MQNCIINFSSAKWFLENLFDFNGKGEVLSYCKEKDRR